MLSNLNFVEQIKSDLGFKSVHREVIQRRGTKKLLEQSEAYGLKLRALHDGAAIASMKLCS